MKSAEKKDALYAQRQDPIKDFVFDETVAKVFEDMIRRSVPGYGAVINMISTLAEEYVQDNSRCYDLGCSLGAGIVALRRGIKAKGVTITAIDNSEAMADKCRANVSDENSNVLTEVICQDIRETEIAQASMVLLNFTLQFISPDERQQMIQKIYEGLLPGGILIISEKITFEDKKEAQAQIKMHEAFKRLNGYSELEVAQKRTALENVLIPDTIQNHTARLQSSGFKRSHVWFQCFNFVSIIAYKD